jgi:hypothetical protein
MILAPIVVKRSADKDAGAEKQRKRKHWLASDRCVFGTSRRLTASPSEISVVNGDPGSYTDG